MTKLTDLQTFDVAASDVSVWVFKTSMSEGRPKFTGRWVGITEDLASELRGAVRTNLDGITETIEYDILAQNNEGSALTIMADETYAHLIAEQVTNETPARKARELKQLRNSKFYVAKLVHGDRTLLAVRKTDATWTTRKVTGRIAMVFRDEELDVDRDPIFTIEPFFDLRQEQGPLRGRPGLQGRAPGGLRDAEGRSRVHRRLRRRRSDRRVRRRQQDPPQARALHPAEGTL
jgi:hypothetical protein